MRLIMSVGVHRGGLRRNRFGYVVCFIFDPAVQAPVFDMIKPLVVLQRRPNHFNPIPALLVFLLQNLRETAMNLHQVRSRANAVLSQAPTKRQTFVRSSILDVLLLVGFIIGREVQIQNG